MNRGLDLVAGRVDLGRRGDEATLDLGHGALREHREAAQRLDRVAPELGAHGVAGRRVDVDDAAAHRELAALAHLLVALVAQAGQRGEDLDRRAPRRPATSASGCGCSASGMKRSSRATASATTTPPPARAPPAPAGARPARALPAPRRLRRAHRAPAASRRHAPGRRQARRPGGRLARPRARRRASPAPGWRGCSPART